MALLQFTLVFGNDHFVLPVPVPVGAVFTTSHLLVTDTFGMTLSFAPAAHAQTGGRAEGPGRWTMFLSVTRGRHRRGGRVRAAGVRRAAANEPVPSRTYTCCATRRQTSHGRSRPWWEGRTAARPVERELPGAAVAAVRPAICGSG